MGSPFCKKLPPRPGLLCARYEGKTPEFSRGSRSQERAKIAPIRLQNASKTLQDISSIPTQVMIAAVSLRFSVSHPILIPHQGTLIARPDGNSKSPQENPKISWDIPGPGLLGAAAENANAGTNSGGSYCGWFGVDSGLSLSQQRLHSNPTHECSCVFKLFSFLSSLQCPIKEP